MVAMLRHLAAIVLICVSFVCVTACGSKSSSKVLPQVDPKLELDKRLTGVDFSLLQSNRDAVDTSWNSLSHSTVIPENWPVNFAGSSVKVPKIDPSHAVGIKHADGRITAVYPFPDSKIPEYGKFQPLALAHYMVPETRLDIVLLLVCFQSDPENSLSGLAVRSLDLQGVETSVPFAIAAKADELRGKFFYDQFLAGSENQAVAGRAEWDRGFLLLTRFDANTVLSTYLTWY
jgi:hypothetical protein